jgi:hypothetical protein
MKNNPIYDIDQTVYPILGDFRNGKGIITEIHIGPYGIKYGIRDLPLSFGKILFFGEKELNDYPLTNSAILK